MSTDDMMERLKDRRDSDDDKSSARPEGSIARCEWIDAAADELERLRAALEKIADPTGAWGPFPENNELWRGMAIITARQAIAAPKLEDK